MMITSGIGASLSRVRCVVQPNAASPDYLAASIMVDPRRFAFAALFVVACADPPDPSERDASSSDGGTQVEFRAVAEILGQRCTSCHREGTVAPFALASHADVAAWAEPIVAEITARTMPPWGVDDSGACQHFVDSRWLSDDEIATIVAWVDAGAPAGTPDDDALLAPPETTSLGDDAHVVEMAEPYTPDATLVDDYRCFVLDAGIAADEFLTAYEVRPGNLAGVHHVLLYQSSSPEADAQAIANDDADDAPGYPCFGGAGIDGYRFLAGWAPGTGITRYPAETGIRVAAGRALILQLHYNLAASSAADRTAIAFELQTTIAKEAEVLPLADLELVLAPGLADVSTMTSTMVEDFGTADIYGVYPHMHTLGRGLRVDLDHAGVTSCLVDVQAWDFGWQQFYFYESTIAVGDGDLATLRCDYDTRTRDAEVTWGEGTADEMCLAGFYFVRT
jgi:hypothetical protein